MIAGTDRGCGGVLLVGDVLEPGGAVAVGGALIQGDVGHEIARCGAVPVCFAGRGIDNLAGPGHDDVAVAGADQRDASVIRRVWPTAWECQAVRAPGVKCTQPQAIRDGSALRPRMASMYTSPVNHAEGPFLVAALGSMFTSDVSFGLSEPTS
jgi:hypothetical protein